MSDPLEAAVKACEEEAARWKSAGYRYAESAATNCARYIHEIAASQINDAAARENVVAWVPADAIEQLKRPTLVLHGVTLLSYAGEGHIPLYTAPAGTPNEIDPATARKIVADLRSELYAIAKTYDDDVLRQRAIEAYENDAYMALYDNATEQP